MYIAVSMLIVGIACAAIVRSVRLPLEVALAPQLRGARISRVATCALAVIARWRTRGSRLM